MRAAYRYWSGVVFLAVLLQIGFAGYGAFAVANDVDGGVVGRPRTGCNYVTISASGRDRSV
jgi:hypothetical protein